jgi:DNA-binding transcriptional regulator YiaG
VVQGLRHRLGLPVERVREELARLIGVSPKTLKGWEYRYCSPDNWRRFAEAVRAFLTQR